MDNDERIDPNESEENSELANFKFNSGFLQLKKTSSQYDVYENGCSKEGVEIMLETGSREVRDNTEVHENYEDVCEVEYEYDENEEHSQFQSW